MFSKTLKENIKQNVKKKEPKKMFYEKMMTISTKLFVEPHNTRLVEKLLEVCSYSLSNLHNLFLV